MKKVYTKKEFAEIVARGEERLGLHLFYSPVIVQPVTIKVLQEAHDADCTCTTCFTTKLDALVTKTQTNLETLQVAFGQE